MIFPFSEDPRQTCIFTTRITISTGYSECSMHSEGQGDDEEQEDDDKKEVMITTIH